MKPERAFIAERPLAQHCPELLRTGPTPAELTPALARFGERFAKKFAVSLIKLLGDDGAKVRCDAPRECSGAELAIEIAPLAANSLLGTGKDNARILASIEAETVLRLVDRTFGGRGEVPATLPEAFPLSAELLITRLEGMVIATMAQALETQADDAIRALRRDGNLSQLAPFREDEQLVALSLVVEEADFEPWRLTLAFAAEALLELFGHGDAPKPARPARQNDPDPASEPFGDMPLTVSALLVDMQIPFSSLSGLQPGQVLPVSVARSVPLRIGDKTIAHGTVGEMDDRVAIQINQAF